MQPSDELVAKEICVYSEETQRQPASGNLGISKNRTKETQKEDDIVAQEEEEEEKEEEKEKVVAEEEKEEETDCDSVKEGMKRDDDTSMRRGSVAVVYSCW